MLLPQNQKNNIKLFNSVASVRPFTIKGYSWHIIKPRSRSPKAKNVIYLEINDL